MKYKNIKIEIGLEEGVYNYLLNKGDFIEDAIVDVLTKEFYAGSNKAISNKNEKGLLNRAYNNYKGERNYTKTEFVDHMYYNNKYNKLFKKYRNSGFDKRKMPSFILTKNLNDIKVMTYNKRMMLLGNIRSKVKLS